MNDAHIRPSYELPTSDLGGLSMAGHVQRIEAIIAWVNSKGIRTAGTRLARYRRYLIAAEAGGADNIPRIFVDPPGHPFKSPLDRFLYVLREVHELFWIFEGMKTNIPVGLDQKLARAIGGADFAALDKASVSRDTQFELRIAAYFSRAGYCVDLSNQTDIIARSQAPTYYFECKRVGSAKRLQTRIKEARDQLDRRLPRGKLFLPAFGIIAVDVTKVAFSHNGLTMGLTAEHSRDVLRDKLQMISGELESISGLFDSAELLAVVLQIHIPCVVMNPPQTLTRFSFLTTINPNLGPLGTAAFLRFAKLFPSGMDPQSTDSLPRERPLRKSVTFETGTTLWWEPKLVDEFIKTGSFPAFDEEHEVFKIVKAGKKIEFSFSELKLAAAQLDESDTERLRGDRKTFMSEMMARLYMQRFRYEDE